MTVPATADEEIIKLLQEIRDLQKMYIENYKDALTNQRESIEMQRKATRRQKVSLLVLLAIVLLGIAFVVVH